MALAGIEDRWVIKAADNLVGIVVHDGIGWVFFAAASNAWALNGKTFESVQDVERAVREHTGARSISTAARPNAF